MNQAAAVGGSEAEAELQPEPEPEPLLSSAPPAVAKEEQKWPGSASVPASGAKEKTTSTVPLLPPPPGLPLAARRALASLSEEASKLRRSRRSEEGKPGRHGRQKKTKRVVTVDTSKAKTSSEALKICIQQLKWKEFPTGRRHLCDIYWHGSSFHDGEVSSSGQVNKYPGMTELVRKINFSRAVRTMQELFPEEYKFYPRSWILPEEYQTFADQILGFDILLMKNMKPVLLEVNANPSMRIEHEQEISPGLFEYVASPVDEEIKVAIIRDTLCLVDPALKKNNRHQSCLTDVAADSDKEKTTEAELHDMNGTPSSKEQNLSSLCLKQVFPKYSRQFSYLLIVDRIALLFIRFLGIKGSMKLGPTGFRTFIRTCKLSNSNLSMASVDILYIDIARRWNVIRGDRGESGMCFQAFMEAIFHLAQRRYKTPPLREQVEALVNFCDYQLEVQEDKHILYGRGTTDQRLSLTMYQPEGSRSGATNHMHLLNRMSMSNRLPASSLPASADQQLVNSMSSRVTDCSPAASFSPNGWDNLGCRFCRNANQSCSVIGLSDVRSQRLKLTQILRPSVTSYFM
ncbi:tubulin polyglutamylase TTLL11 isoform X3 [Hemiscyllium ocellatum]|uniref:tubulin polyglutamylase TTLL11 isoform X3 n=1 Tax=Hemiscyllium ocellatum TaxID=170820 RepID=UPI002966C24A|nr:tubulin polyglutamylase TTLL11 isoform X3 [Hemiscyllium ocellatum]